MTLIARTDGWRSVARQLTTVAVGTFTIARAAAAQIAPPVDLHVPIGPSPVAGDGKIHLAYELHVTNFGSSELGLRTMRVMDAARDTTLLEYTGQDLRNNIRRVGMANAGASDLDRVPGGMRAVVFVWVTVPDRAHLPNALRHSLVITMFRNGDTTEATVSGVPLPIDPAPVTIGSPLRGDNWLAANGPSNGSGHRRALIPIEGAARIAQRFAIDWVQLADGATSSGDREDNTTYHAWGAEAIAVADAIVVSVKDGIPENVPGLESRAVPITLETVGGNYVILDIGGGRFAFYAHLQPGSLRVRPGDRVRRGDVVGLVGNSGNSTEPHLHFHLANGDSPLGAEGIPYLLDGFDVVGRVARFGVPPVRQPAERRVGEIPLGNMVVSFGR